jgi:hypothetical protein
MTEATPLATRPKRTPLHSRNKLTAQNRKGYVRRFVNDDEDRIREFEEAGWKIVRGDVPVGDKSIAREASMGSPVMKSVGGGKKAYLMETKEEWYAEDQDVKQKKIQETVNEMIRNREEGQYGKIEVSDPSKK